MKDFDLIDFVVPKGGIYNVVGIKNDKLTPKFTDSIEEAYSIAETFSEQGKDVYFALGRLKEKGTRKLENVESLGAIWLDIDCGGDKAEEIEPKTGLPKGYASKEEGSKALKKFCDTVDLPAPVIVSSGYGLHVYWAFTEPLPKQRWQPIADRLEQVCIAQKFYADPNVFDASRILRVPGTYNHKKDEPKLVKVVRKSSKRHTPEHIRSLLGVTTDIAKPQKSGRERGPLEKLLDQNVDCSFERIILKHKAPCRQLRDSLVNRKTLSEPRWFNALSIAKFCEDGDKAIHKLSQGHPDYDYHAVERKIVGIKAPHTCEHFSTNNPNGCEGCPHIGKIKSPIVLGRIVKAAVNPKIKYPKPYFRGQNGGIYRNEPEGEATFIYEHDFYLEKRMTDAELGDVCVFKFHTPHDGLKEFLIPNDKVVEKRDLLRQLAKNGVVAKKGGPLHEYVTDSILALQNRSSADIMRVQFGWADNDTKFIVGEREITVDAVYHTPASTATAPYARYMEPKGTIEKWREAFSIYNRKGLEIQAFAALSGFGAPLLKFTGQKGAIINLVYKDSGSGKTTVLRMANSICGDPEQLLGLAEDSAPGRINKLGFFNNIAYPMDELTNMDGKELGVLAYACSQGKGREKASVHANINRKNDITWRTITITTSNASFYQKLLNIKTSPDGELMRIIEFVIEKKKDPVVTTEEGQEILDLQLNSNFGHAIVPFIQFVIANPKYVEETLRDVRQEIDRRLNLTQRERNWSAVLSANIAAGIIATKIKLPIGPNKEEVPLIDFDMKRIIKNVMPVIRHLREVTTAPVDVPTAQLADFLNSHISNTLVIDGEADQRAQKRRSARLEPRGPLCVRYEPDTERLFVKVRALRNFFDKSQTDIGTIEKELKACGMHLETKNCRLGRGYPMASGSERCWVLDGGHNDFIDADAFYDKAIEDENREGGVPDKLE